MALNIVKDIDSRVAVRNVLMSVSDKTGLETFVPALVKACPGVKIYSTGGTYGKVKEILGAEADKTLVAVSDYTGQPEMQGGLVKTLDFKIYLGLLSETYNESHQADLKRLSALPIDMVSSSLTSRRRWRARTSTSVGRAWSGPPQRTIFASLPSPIRSTTATSPPSWRHMAAQSASTRVSS